MFFGISGCSLMLLYHMIFGQFFPNIHGKLGHDYALFLPKLLDGYFWYHVNGLFTVPWFTPAFCGGIPLMPDPQSIYYSFPQFLSFMTDPLTSVYLTVLVFAGSGFVGFYVLLRVVFATTPWTALLGAGLFLFNGFYVHRMIIGHLTYHPFMLVPWLAFFLLRTLPESRQTRRPRLACDVVLSGLLWAYTFQAGMVNAILPAVASVWLIGLIYSVMSQRPPMFWRRMLLSGALALSLCSAKLIAATAYLYYFTRDAYQLPGARSLIGAAGLIAHALFIAPAPGLAEEVLVNVQWALDRHEFEFGITFIPLLLLLIGSAAMVSAAHTRGWRSPLHFRQWLQIGAIIGLLSLPVFLNYYTPAWNAVLKQIPILKNSTSLVRWVSLYIPVTILLAALAVERATMLRKYQLYVVACSLAGVVLLNITTDRDYYQAQPYDPRLVVDAYYRVQRRDWAPSMSHTVVFTDAAGRATMPLARNDVLALGNSQLLCYEPLFGYRLEAFPFKTIRPGALMDANNGWLNLKNPVCYVYPVVNACAPGDHFSVHQRQAAEAFVHYRPFPVRLPVRQKLANLFNLGSVAGVAGFLMVAALVRSWRWLAGRRHHS